MRRNSTDFKLLGSIVIKTIHCCKIIQMKLLYMWYIFFKCKMVHITRVTPPSLASDALVSFDEDVRQCFVLSSAIEVSDTAWKQAQLSLRFGGLGLRSLSCHAAAAFISSLSSSGLGKLHNLHLQQAVTAYNSKSPLITQSQLSLSLLLPFLRESFPARLMRINSNLY